jgi:hypothetical protein
LKRGQKLPNNQKQFKLKLKTKAGHHPSTKLRTIHISCLLNLSSFILIWICSIIARTVVRDSFPKSLIAVIITKSTQLEFILDKDLPTHESTSNAKVLFRCRPHSTWISLKSCTPVGAQWGSNPRRQRTYPCVLPPGH